MQLRATIYLYGIQVQCTTTAYFDDEIDLGKFGNVVDIDDLDVDWELSSIHAFEKMNLEILVKHQLKILLIMEKVWSKLQMKNMLMYLQKVL